MSRSPSHALAEQHSDFSEALALIFVRLGLIGFGVFAIVALGSLLATGHWIAVPEVIHAAGRMVGFLMAICIVPILGKEESHLAMWFVRATVFGIQVLFLFALPIGIFMRLTHR